MVGADEPEGTWSIPSTVVQFHTQPSYIGPSEQDLVTDIPWTSAASEVSFSLLTMSETFGSSVMTTSTSKTRKRLLSAVAAGQETQICTQGEETTASGCGDEYM